MKKNEKVYQKLCIDIIAYKTIYENTNIEDCNMDKKILNQNRFICSICLNQNCADDNKESEFCERKSKSCPICQHSYFSSVDGSNITKDTDRNDVINVKRNTKDKKDVVDIRKVTNDTQSSQPDVTQGLSLLNEVLSVFQSKKSCNRVDNRKTRIFKDVGVATEGNLTYNNKNKTKLTMSKIFQYSIEEKRGNENKFAIVSSCQPETVFLRKSIDIIKHKSSSIPQMKLEELKYSLKEKTKSKDGIEEANRIFATVKRVEQNDTINRPAVRNGPRVLPVVKMTKYDMTDNKKDITKTDQTVMCGHENNFCLSSGDSCRQKCCNKCTDDYVYMLCSHCKQRQIRESCKRCCSTKL